MKLLLLILLIAITLFSEEYAMREEDWGAEEKYGESVYDTLAVRFDKNWFTRLLYESVVVKNDPPVIPNDPSDMKSPYSAYEGLLIDSIEIFTIRPFDNDSLWKDSVKVGERFREQVTLKTYEPVIRSMLGFRSGDPLKSYQLEEAERYLRSKAYISDVRIVVVKTGENSAKVKIIKKERFPYSISFSMSNLYSFKLGLNNRNFGRIGGDFRNTFYYNNKNEQKLGYGGRIHFNDIGRTQHHVRLDLDARHNYDMVRLKVGRDFERRDIVDAWGADLFFRSEVISVPEEYDVELYGEFNEDLKSHGEELWYGHAFNSKVNNTQSLYLVGSYGRVRFIERPLVSLLQYQEYHNEDLVLGKVVLRDLDYFRSRMIFSFGVTEDVPYGMLFHVTGGYQFGEFWERSYLDMRLIGANYIPRVGYLLGAAGVGSFFRNNEYEDAVITLKLFYYSPLFSMGRSRMRILCNSEYIEGFNLLSHDELSLNKKVRYVSTPEQRGSSRITFRTEPVLFLPWNLIGFRFAPFLFSDFSFLAGSSEFMTSEDLVWGLGGGIRIRNENLVFNTLEIAGGYYPPAFDRDGEWKLSFKSSLNSIFRQFKVGKPELMEFN